MLLFKPPIERKFTTFAAIQPRKIHSLAFAYNLRRLHVTRGEYSSYDMRAVNVS